MTRPDDVGSCCGTTCNAQATLEYIKELEQDRHELRAELAAARRTIRLLRREHGPTEGDTTGAT